MLDRLRSWVGSGDLGTLAISGLHLAVLWTFAVAQPLFDLLARNAEFFAIRGSRPVDIVVFAVGLVALPPLAATLALGAAGLVDSRLRSGLGLVLIAVLVAAIALQVLKDVVGSDRSSMVLLGLSSVAGLAAALAYARVAVARSLLTVLAPAPFAFLALFLLLSPVTKLVFPDDRAGEAVAGVTSRTPVVMVVFDELPVASLLDGSGRIDATRYPGFAALARTSDWYRNTATVHAGTEQAVPAILDARRPGRDELPLLADHPRNLFTLLGRSHRPYAVESVTRMCPDDLCRDSDDDQGLGDRLASLASDTGIVALHLLLPDNLREDLPSISNRWQDFGGEGLDPVGEDGTAGADRSRQGFSERVAASERTRIGRVRRFIASIRAPRAAERPPLYFLHSLFPHTPWQYLPSGLQYSAARSRIGQVLDRWSDDPLGPALGQQRHLLQVGFTDRLLRRVMARLRSTGLLDRALIVVTADHGISFRSGLRPREVSAETVAEVAPVPLFIKRPGQHRGRVIRRQIETIDILPTVAELLGVELPWEVDGRSALSGPPVRRLRIGDSGADSKVFDAGDVRRLEAAALRRRVRMFGAGDAGERLYAVGPRPDLVGRQVDELPAVQSAASIRASIDQGTLLASVDPGSGLVPTHITGELTPAPDAPVDVAVAVNGTIRAVTRTLAGGRGEYAAMIPESALRPGSNRVEVLRVSSEDGRVALARAGAAGGGGASFTLAGGALRRSNGRPVAIGDRIRGVVDDSLRVGPVVRLSGWALEADSRDPVQRVLAFVGDRLVADVAPRELQPDVAELLDTEPFDLGWRAEFPASELGRSRAGVRVFGLAGSQAGPLSFRCDGAGLAPVGCPRVELTERVIAIAGQSDLRIRRAGVKGFLDASTVRGGNLELGGWAMTTPGRRPVDRIFVFSDGGLVVSGAPETPRPDVASTYGINSYRLGFRLRAPARLADRDVPLRAFGVHGRAAVPLGLACPPAAAVGC